MGVPKLSPGLAMLSRIAAKIGSAIVPVGEGRRPVLLDRLIRRGLEALGVEASPELMAKVRRAIVEGATSEVQADVERLTAERDRLAREVKTLRKAVDQGGPVMPEADLVRLRTLLRFGLTAEQAAPLFGISVVQVKEVAQGKGRVALGHVKPPGQRRALDL